MNRCTTERVLDGLRDKITAKLQDNYGATRRCRREHEYPEAFDPRQTPAVGIEEGDQTSILDDAEIEQDVTLLVKVMANELTGGPEYAAGYDEETSGPRVLPLLNEVYALLDELFTADQPLLGGIAVTFITADKRRSKEAGDGEAFGRYPVTLRYARLAGPQIGEES